MSSELIEDPIPLPANKKVTSIIKVWCQLKQPDKDVFYLFRDCNNHQFFQLQKDQVLIVYRCFWFADAIIGGIKSLCLMTDSGLLNYSLYADI